MKKDNYQAIFNLMAQLVINGTNFVLIMIFTRLLSTADYGTVSIFQAYSLFFTVVVGLSVGGSIGTAFIHFKERERQNYLASIMLLAISFFVVVLSLIIVFLKPFSSFSELPPQLIILMLFYSFGNFCFQFANVKYIYLRKSQFSCIMAVLVSITMILFSWFGVKYQEIIGLAPYLIRILSICVPYLVCEIYVLASIFSKGNPFIGVREYWSFCIPICLPLVFHGLSQMVLGQTDKIMIQKLLLDSSLVGVYSFIVTFVHIMNSIYTALNNTWVPIYYEYTKENDIASIQKRANNYSILFLCLCIGFMLVAPEFVKLFADSAYWEGSRLIPFIVLAVFFTFLYSFAVNYELYHRKSKWIAVGTTAAALINILLNALLIPRFTLYGAAIATLLAYFLLFLFHQIYAFKLRAGTQYPFSIMFFTKYIVLMVTAVVAFVILEGMTAIRWGLGIGMAVYLVSRMIKNRGIF